MPADVASLYDAYASRVYALALRITGNRDIAADLVEDLFVRIGNGSLVHDPSRGGFDAWLLRTARDTAVARRQAQNEFSSVDQKEATPRSLVETVFFGGMSAAELARMHSLDEGEIRRRLHLGMTELRREFAETR